VFSSTLPERTPFITSTKYIGMDVHKESISIAVMNVVGKIVMECVIETKANVILQCIDGLRGDLHVTFEEGTSAAWLYDLPKPHVTELIVCDPRKNASMRADSQNDKIDARRLAELLRIDHLKPQTGLSVSERVRSILGIFSGGGRRVLETPWFESESQLISGRYMVHCHNLEHEDHSMMARFDVV